jgi:hypothetical protein
LSRRAEDSGGRVTPTGQIGPQTGGGLLATWG